MQLEIYHWLAPLIAIFYIIRTIKQYSLGKYSPRNTIVWIVFWIGVALLGIMPNEIANSLSKGLGFRDAPNAIIFVALGLLFLMVFYLSAALNRVENQLTELVREIALKEIGQNTSSTNNTNENHPKEKKYQPFKDTTPTPTIFQKDMKDLENIVQELTLPDAIQEPPNSIPSEGKMPNSTPKE